MAAKACDLRKAPFMPTGAMHTRGMVEKRGWCWALTKAHVGTVRVWCEKEPFWACGVVARGARRRCGVLLYRLSRFKNTLGSPRVGTRPPGRRCKDSVWRARTS